MYAIIYISLFQNAISDNPKIEFVILSSEITFLKIALHTYVDLYIDLYEKLSS